MNLEIVKIPQLNPSEPINVANYWVESVVKKAKYPNEAWAFLQFLTMPENIKRYSTATHQPSPVRSHIAEQKADPTLAPFAELVLQSENWYRGRNFSQTKEAFSNMITGLLEPLADGENKQVRDANLIIQTARLVQQSM
jgi:ABC-type glycerol-3-phosphate transport system substrate-binding protein